MPTLNINGRRVQVDESFLSLSPEQQEATVNEIARSLGVVGESPAAPEPTPPSGGNLADFLAGFPSEFGGQVPAAPEPAVAPKPETNLMTDTAYVLQRGDRGWANALGLPVDLATGAINLGAWGVDKVAEMFGGNMDYRVENPVFGSDWIADQASKLYESMGGTIVQPEDVSQGARLAGTAAEFAGSALPISMGLASGPVQQMVQAGRGGTILKGLAEPYRAAPGATIVRDAAAGLGSGLAAQAHDDYLPESWQTPIGKAVAALIGGIGGMTALSAGEGLVRGAGRAIKNMTPWAGDKNAPINPATGKRYSAQEMDFASKLMQDQATDRFRAAGNIDENLDFYRQFARPEEIPTVGMLADDIGLAIGENLARAKNAKPFAERDHSRLAKASDLVERTRPQGANQQAFIERGTQMYDETLGAARRQVDEALAAQQAARDDLIRQNMELEAYRANQQQASSALAEDFESARRAARQEKNIRYDAADPNTPVRGDFLKEAVDRIDAQMSDAEKLAGGPYAEIARRVRRLVESVDPETGEIVTRDVTYADLKALRAQVSEARKNAIRQSGQSVAGSGADVQRLDQLSAILGRMADEINPEAARFYREEYAPRFKEGRAGEYGAAIDRSVATGGESSATRGSQFAERFLRHPEDAASLRRALTPLPEQADNILPGPGGAAKTPRPTGPDPKVEQNVKEWMLGDLAKSGVLTDNAEIRYDRFKRWVDRNRETISQFPELAKTVDEELARAQRGGALSKQLAEDVKRAKENLNMTERELRLSALHHTIGTEPVQAVGSVIGGKNPTKQMAELVERFKGDDEALKGLKDATIEWLKQEAGLKRALTGHDDAARLSAAKIEGLFQKHEETLAKLFTPEEMNSLRQARKLVADAQKLDIKTTGGSNTYDKFMAAQNDTQRKQWRVLEAALKARYGVLKGGGVFRTIRLFAESLTDRPDAISDILLEAQFNPDLARHLLTRDVEHLGSPDWNKQLNRLLAAAIGGRESGRSDEERRPLELTITEPSNAK